MTATERTISDRLRAIPSKHDMKDGAFINQLRNWYDRDMSNAGRKMLLRLLQKYSGSIPDSQQLYNQIIDEELNKMAP